MQLRKKMELLGVVMTNTHRQSDWLPQGRLEMVTNPLRKVNGDQREIELENEGERDENGCFECMTSRG